jgi:hypothetical protein
MINDDKMKMRHSIIAALATRKGGLGRTAFMKLVYFLQTLRNVPLGYRFRIYTYGPFDDQVLDDLDRVEQQGAISSQYYECEHGTGYSIKADRRAVELAGTANDAVGGDLDWVVGRFGAWSAVDLEIASTIVFVDRANARAGKTSTGDDMARAVHAVKPHLDFRRIRNTVEDLQTDHLLRTVA